MLQQGHTSILQRQTRRRSRACAAETRQVQRNTIHPFWRNVYLETVGNTTKSMGNVLKNGTDLFALENSGRGANVMAVGNPAMLSIELVHVFERRVNLAAQRRGGEGRCHDDGGIEL